MGQILGGTGFPNTGLVCKVNIDIQNSRDKRTLEKLTQV